MVLRRLLFAAISFCSSLGAVSDPVQTPLRRVNGVLRRSVLLSFDDIPPSEKVARVEWDFQPQPRKGLFIAEFKDGKLERPDPKDRFGLRLKMVNETTLRIRNLGKEDSGVYRARVRLHPAAIEVHTFQLTIYDPVPEPQILLLQEVSNSSSKCNVTLRCLVSEKGGLSVSWRVGDALEPLEGGLDWYRFSSEGWSLHLSIPMDSNITCLVSNPADQKSDSIDLTGTCSLQGAREGLWMLFFPIAIVIVFGAGFWIWKKSFPPSDAADSTETIKTDSELDSLEIATERSSPEGNNDQVFQRDGGCQVVPNEAILLTNQSCSQQRSVPPIKTETMGADCSPSIQERMRRRRTAWKRLPKTQRLKKSS